MEAAQKLNKLIPPYGIKAERVRRDPVTGAEVPDPVTGRAIVDETKISQADMAVIYWRK